MYAEYGFTKMFPLWCNLLNFLFNALLLPFLLSRPDADNVLIILTDGKPTLNVGLTSGARKALGEEDDVVVYAFGITDAISQGNLTMLAGKDNFWHLTDFSVSAISISINPNLVANIRGLSKPLYQRIGKNFVNKIL